MIELTLAIALGIMLSNVLAAPFGWLLNMLTHYFYMYFWNKRGRCSMCRCKADSYYDGDCMYHVCDECRTQHKEYIKSLSDSIN